MAKQLTKAEKDARAQAKADKKAAADAKAAADKKAAEQEIKDAESDGETTTVPVEPCPACPPGKHRVRSRYPDYRWRGVQFHGNCAVVDSPTFERMKADSYFGQGNDFWEDKAA